MVGSACLTQDLVEQFFKTKAASGFRQPWHRLTALPDAYNYKVPGEPAVVHAAPAVLLTTRLLGLVSGIAALCQQAAHLLHWQRSAGVFTLGATAPSLQAYWGEPEAGWMSMFTHQVGLRQGAGAGHGGPRERCRQPCLIVQPAMPAAHRLPCYAQWLLLHIGMQVGDVAIVHTHGPKPELSL